MVPERHGFAYNKRPLLTNDFEVTVSFRASGGKVAEALLGSFSAPFGAVFERQTPLDQSFAFWFVRENISKDFNESRMIKAGRQSRLESRLPRRPFTPEFVR